jgi:hypothetical protein
VQRSVAYKREREGKGREEKGRERDKKGRQSKVDCI